GYFWRIAAFFNKKRKTMKKLFIITLLLFAGTTQAQTDVPEAVISTYSKVSLHEIDGTFIKTQEATNQIYIGRGVLEIRSNDFEKMSFKLILGSGEVFYDKWGKGIMFKVKDYYGDIWEVCVIGDVIMITDFKKIVMFHN